MIPVGTPGARYKRAHLKTEAAATGQMRKEIQNQRKNARLKTKAATTGQMPAAGGRRAMIL
jgi:hypothetical protein